MSAAADYHRPTQLDEALGLLSKGHVKIAAGCTDLFPATRRKRLPGAILDITAVPELRGITTGVDGIRIGGASTWSDIIQADLPPACDGLKLAAREVGAKQIQNRGTIAGNLCNASPAADGVPPLLTLNGEVELVSAKGVRRMRLDDFMQGPRQTALAPDELLSAVVLPQAGLLGAGGFQKLGARSYLVISIAMVAARLVLRDGIVADAALSVGACGPVATRLPLVEAALTGRAYDPALITQADVSRYISPIDDMRAEARYRAEAATELLRRVAAGIIQAEATA